MVEEMKYVSITGSVDNMNHFVEQYLSRYDIQLEYASKQLGYSEGFQPYTGANPYMEAMHKAERFMAVLEPVPSVHYETTGEQAIRMVEAAFEVYEKRDIKLKDLEFKRDAIKKYVGSLQNFTSFDMDLQVLDGFKHISCSFGRLPVSNFRQFEKFLYDDSEIVFFKSHSDHDHVWGVYFTPKPSKDKVNSIFSSLHFERIPISGTMLGERRPGTPAALIPYWQGRLNEIEASIKSITDNILGDVNVDPRELAVACQKVMELYNISDLKKYAAVTSKKPYVFMGWMTKKDADTLESELDDDELTFFSRSGDLGEHTLADSPPTRLVNPPVIRLFEFFTHMYGIPAYGELDPTPIMAFTYTLLFGLMFGDVGQGLCIAALGYFVYKRFKTDLGGIMTVIGLSGAFFGFMYGSIFGLEEILPALWRRPAEDINGTLIFGVGIGVFIIFMSMVLNIINCVRLKRWGELFFSPNGIAGMMFYGIVLILALQVLLNGHSLTGLDIALACLPLVFVTFREPLIKFMEGERDIFEGGIAIFLFQTLFELIEVLLTYVTNTISFIRVGAFAISHAGIMSVVLLLSRTAAGTHSPLGLVLGNILVMGIEGLLVGIQVLRLDFYEIFNRFYSGGGIKFESCRIRKSA